MILTTIPVTSLLPWYVLCVHNIQQWVVAIESSNITFPQEVETLLSSAKATEVLQYIQNLSGSASGRTSCWDSSTVGQGSGSGSTTHLSVVDGMGNAVSVTSTINQ